MPQEPSDLVRGIGTALNELAQHGRFSPATAEFVDALANFSVDDDEDDVTPDETPEETPESESEEKRTPPVKSTTTATKATAATKKGN